MQKLSGIFGLLAITVFLVSLTVFASLSPDFNFAYDVVSKLGAYNQPLAQWWNLIGFGFVGLLLATFGVTYGNAINDKLVSVLLALFGLAFMAASIPAYLESADSIQTKIHFVVVTFCMAFWCLSLARINSKPEVSKRMKMISNISATFAALAFIGYIVGQASAAIFQKLFFAGIFFWIASVSWDNLFVHDLNKNSETE